jgi:hypothetical protein
VELERLINLVDCMQRNRCQAYSYQTQAEMLFVPFIYTYESVAMAGGLMKRLNSVLRRVSHDVLQTSGHWDVSLIGRSKMLISHEGCEAQLLHQDTSTPAIAAILSFSENHNDTNMTEMRQTSRSFDGKFGELSDVDHDSVKTSLAYLLPWRAHPVLSARKMPNGSATFFAGTMIHRGPKPAVGSGLRVSLFAACRRSLTALTPDDLEAQTFEFNYAHIF